MLMTFVMVLGVFRSIFKPTMLLLEAYVLATPSKNDDEKLAGFKSSKAYATIVWIVDYLASIKLPKPQAKPDDVPRAS